MNVFEAVNGTFEHLIRKLPRWAGILILFWLLFAGLTYFGAIALPEIGWWRLLVMAPMVVIVLAALLQMVIYAATWVSAPARWLLKKWRAH
ncbi:MAG TPA: hypothetical protein VF027_06755 [Sphingomicrobium sp.]